MLDYVDWRMTTLEKLAEQALSLSKPGRITLAQRLWESVADAELPIYTQEELQAEIRGRLSDKDEGHWVPRKEAMALARNDARCVK